jgi:hypothetical protein
MKIQPGWRYGAVVLGQGRFEGFLEGPAGADVLSEGGGEVVMKRWNLRLDDGDLLEVQEAELTVTEPRRLGQQPGPITCPACKGTGGRAKPRSLTREICGRCKGEGIAYPE